MIGRVYVLHDTKYTVNSEIFANCVKRHIFDFKDSRPEHDLPSSVNDWVISPFCEGLIFAKTSLARSFSKMKPSGKFTNLKYKLSVLSL